MAQYKVIKALKADAKAEREKGLMALDLLTNNGIGIGDHTADDFFNDAKIALQRLNEADDLLSTIERYYPEN
jgi:hypothetical protein